MNVEYLVYMHMSPCGKAYIGQTKGYTERCRALKKDKGTLIGKTIQSIGWNNFKHEILKDGLTKEEAIFWEDFYIKKFNTIYPNGFNKKISTEYSKASKKQMSESAKGRTTWNKGKKLTAEHKAKLSKAKKLNPPKSMLGKKFTEEHKLKLSIARKKRVTKPETIAKMSASNKGKKRSPETILRMKEAWKLRKQKECIDNEHSNRCD